MIMLSKDATLRSIYIVVISSNPPSSKKIFDIEKLFKFFFIISLKLTKFVAISYQKMNGNKKYA